MMILPKAFAFVLLFSGSTEAVFDFPFFNADPVDIDIPVSNLVIKAEPGELEEECNICGGGSLPEVNQRLQVGASTIEDCFALTTITEDEKSTFCGLIEFFDGFDCGSAQSNKALFPDFCPGFQNTLGVACDCSSVVLAPPAPASESVPVPGNVPDSTNGQEDTDEPGGFLAVFLFLVGLLGLGLGQVYIYPEYFETVLELTLNLPVIELHKPFESQDNFSEKSNSILISYSKYSKQEQEAAGKTTMIGTLPLHRVQVQ